MRKELGRGQSEVYLSDVELRKRHRQGACEGREGEDEGMDDGRVAGRKTLGRGVEASL